jgi:AcrR family transcriptional regulator
LSNIGQSGGFVLESASGRAIADRRTVRTRRALLTAFIELVLERGYAAIGIGDIVDRADIGRSTFYAHFSGKDELLIASMQWMFDILSDATSPNAPRDPLEMLVAHFWSNRRLARVVLSHPVEPKLRRALTATIQRRLGAEARANADLDFCELTAIRIATAQLGILAAWTRGDVSASQAAVADAILATAHPAP